MAQKHPVQTVAVWLKANLGNRCLMACTSQDWACLLASVAIIEAYSHSRSPQLLTAWGSIVRQMQPQTRELAFHAVAHVLDWSDRAEVWHFAGFDPLTFRRLCAWEPGGSARQSGKEAA